MSEDKYRGFRKITSKEHDNYGFRELCGYIRAPMINEDKHIMGFCSLTGGACLENIADALCPVQDKYLRKEEKRYKK